MEEIMEATGKREQASREMQDFRDLQSRHGEPGSAGQGKRLLRARHNQDRGS